MPTSTDVTNLRINTLTQAQYDAAVQAGIIGANEISIITDASESPLPSQTGNSGKFLTTDGTNVSWATVDVFPLQTGNSGKFLTTNGTAVSWATVEALPSQSGNSGKFLTTNGSAASWATINALTNLATASQALNIAGDPSYSNQDGNTVVGIQSSARTGHQCTVIGAGSIVNASSSYSGQAICIGYSNSSNGTGNIVLGVYASTETENSYAVNHAYAIGGSSHARRSNSMAIGRCAETTAESCIQISLAGSSTAITNSDADTVKIANRNGNFEMMSADGTIPTDRFTTTPSADGTYVPTLTISSGTATRSWAAPGGGGATSATATLTVNDWSNNSQTVNVTGVTASNNVIVAPAPASQSDYTTAGILCTAQGAGTLSFTCTTTPSSAITVNVLII